MTCGSACGQYLEIGRWDGANWTNEYVGSEVTDFISFVDYYNDGRIEIIINYHTQYKFDSTYPDRLATDIYGWKNGKLSLLGESRSPNTEPYAVMRDVFSAIYEGKIDDALKLAQPTLDKIPKTCAEMETYTAIEVMLAQAVKNQPGAMQASLAQINKYCAQPDNGFTAAANILWQAYQQVHDPALACEAMDRFIVEQNSSYNQNSSFKFFGQNMNASDLYYGSGFCPFRRQ